MTNRQLKAVANALIPYGINDMWRSQAAQAAINASDAKYVPMLVEALKEIEAIGSATSLLATLALNQLPEDLRQTPESEGV